jgi:thiamine-monophosphate kinase
MHVLTRSGVAATVNYAQVPRAAAFRQLGNPELEKDCVLSGGDDYELLFTAAAERRGALAALARELRIPLSRIGSITRGEPKLTVLDESGRSLPHRGGFDHFGE